MLHDPALSHLIWWTNRNGEQNTFALCPGKEFADCLTQYFKHGNVASFVRQLHMYGFHKVSDPCPLHILQMVITTTTTTTKKCHRFGNLNI